MEGRRRARRRLGGRLSIFVSDLKFETAFKRITLLALVPGSNRNYKNRLFSVNYGSLRQSDRRPDPRLLRQAALEPLTRSARTDSPRRTGRKQFTGDDRRRRRRRTVGGGGGAWGGEEGRLLLGFRVD
ncbi:hypothetical protein F511_45179 [Dorcoceras hygrometricum]|uniref:Uncharacterized protein n=1 Tax=Dorcoceras hygrometricum TaxID=472368 RepID=A0A2Z6ZWS0_9LAMI|nr:hypothetical protein F511_45179 [Dorcoceras hygrometricum]